METLADTARVPPRLEAGESVVLRGPDSPPFPPFPNPSEPSLGFYSSGSTGRPTPHFAPWARLKGEARAGEPGRWASPFAPHSFAGAQVAIQAWASGTAPLSLPANPLEAWKLLQSNGIDCLSCTPSYLQLLLLAAPVEAGEWKPRQITLGGEPLRPRAGAWFAERFPSARFTVIYAAAEFGLLLKTRRLDGWYEMESLSRRHVWRAALGGVEIKRGEAWWPLPDVLEFDGGLARVVGRRDQVVNVGGAKVDLNQVATAALGVPGVLRALPGRAADPILGQIVTLRCELEPEASEEVVRPLLEVRLRGELAKPAWPRRWDYGPIPLGPNAKQVLS